MSRQNPRVTGRESLWNSGACKTRTGSLRFPSLGFRLQSELAIPITFSKSCEGTFFLLFPAHSNYKHFVLYCTLPVHEKEISCLEVIFSLGIIISYRKLNGGEWFFFFKSRNLRFAQLFLELSICLDTDNGCVLG